MVKISIERSQGIEASSETQISNYRNMK
uniref:Uncharacterized protein n=1 Tax=Rhizophora mucronata TaxID=61149 RepID=A0A2P2QWI5_RHIMU